MEDFIFQTSPAVTIMTNTFINVPVIFQYEDTPLIEIVKEAELGWTTQIRMYDTDGAYLAKIKQMRIWPTVEGEDTGISIDKKSDLWVCKRNNETLWEIFHQPGDAFRIRADLHTPDGYFIKMSDNSMPSFFDPRGRSINVFGNIIRNNLFSGERIGVLLKKNGSIQLGVR